MRAPGPDARALVFVACFLASAAQAAQAATVAETTKVVSEGCAEGVSPASRDAAALDARRNAVWLWLELELGREPGDEFLPLLDHLDTYVATTRLHDVRAEDGNTCVGLDAYLHEWPLRADTAALLFRLRAAPPRVAFVFLEHDTAAGSRTFQTQTRAAKLFTDHFAEKGFTLVDATAAAPAYSERELLSIAEAGEAALARYGAEVGADAVVGVEVTLSSARDSASAGGYRAKAEVQTRAVSVSTGRLYDRSRAEAEIECAKAATGFGFALPDAFFKVRDRAVVGAILAAQSGGGEQIRLTIEGAGDFVTAQRFAELLRAHTGVRDPTVVAVRSGTALLSFAYGGRMGDLVEFLEAGHPGLPKLETKKVAGTEMLLRATP